MNDMDTVYGMGIVVKDLRINSATFVSYGFVSD